MSNGFGMTRLSSAEMREIAALGRCRCSHLVVLHDYDSEWGDSCSADDCWCCDLKPEGFIDPPPRPLTGFAALIADDYKRASKVMVFSLKTYEVPTSNIRRSR